MILRLLFEPPPLIPLLRRRELDIESHDQPRRHRAYVHQSEGFADAAVGTWGREGVWLERAASGGKQIGGLGRREGKGRAV